MNLREEIAALERVALESARRTGGNAARAARLLGGRPRRAAIPADRPRHDAETE